MDAAAFERFVERLQGTLARVPHVIGLVALGTTADDKCRDEWSDHDFWVLTEPGEQDALLADLSWLPEADEIAFTVRHGPRGRAVAYSNGHMVEIGVFDVDEARAGKIVRFRVLIDRGGVGELATAVQRQTLEQARSIQTPSDILRSLCVQVWTACARARRGEQLSARMYLDGFAVNQFLRLVLAYAGEEGLSVADELDGRRRLEAREPALAAAVTAALGGPVCASSLGLLDVVEEWLRPRAPDLPWGDVGTVRRWIVDVGLGPATG